MWHRLKRYFISGLVVFLPLMLTVYLFVILLAFSDGILGKYLEPYFEARWGFYVRGLSILIAVSLIIVIGFFVTNYFGKRIHAFFEGMILRLPFFRQVYPALKQMALFLFSREKLAFKKVVLVEYPRKGIYSIGFLTNPSSQRLCDAVREDLCNVFVPSAPGPLTGYVVLFPKKEVTETNLSVEEAIKLIVSGGVVNPLS